jgi:hypothetical protein
MPDLYLRLQEYAEAYGREEPLLELLPAMLEAFLDSDRAFNRRSR